MRDLFHIVRTERLPLEEIHGRGRRRQDRWRRKALA
jgi:hypothetical protein